MHSLRLVCNAHGIALQSLAESMNLTPMFAPADVEFENSGADVRAHIRLSAYFSVKRTVDLLVSITLCILLAPLTVLVATLVLIDVGSPVLFWQERIGRGGRRFLLYKFRTYRAPYDWRGEPVAPEDRLSAIGRFVRATRFDEIPQLLSILVGDMSLIGPRPLLPKDQPKDPTVRLMARPGIAGWAQVNGGNMVTPEEKDALDAWYIQHASPLIDAKILIQSLVIAATGEKLNRGAINEALEWRASLETTKD